MRCLIFLLVFVFTNCTSQKNQYVLTEKDGYTLPAHQVDKSQEASLLNSMRNSNNNADFHKVIINNKEYSPQQFPAILDTLDNSYTFDVKIDLVAKSKVLVITKKK